LAPLSLSKAAKSGLKLSLRQAARLNMHPGKFITSGMFVVEQALRIDFDAFDNLGGFIRSLGSRQKSMN